MVTRRRKAREVVLKALYQLEFINKDPTLIVEEIILQDYFIPAVRDYAKVTIAKLEKLSGQTQQTDKIIEMVCSLPTNSYSNPSELESAISKIFTQILGEENSNIFLPELKIDHLTNKIAAKYSEILPIVDFAKELVFKTTQNISKIDQIISDILENWQLDRISLVDKSILRFAICELQNFESIPVGVTLNEAIEIAKKYSTEKSSEFIHGILNGVIKKYKIIKENSSQM